MPRKAKIPEGNVTKEDIKKQKSKNEKQSTPMTRAELRKRVSSGGKSGPLYNGLSKKQLEAELYFAVNDSTRAAIKKAMKSKKNKK
jgi:hypothetical protein